MLAIEVLRRLGRMPPVMIIGLALMALGGLLDVVLGLGPAAHHGHGGIGWERAGHLVAIAGMTLVLAALVIHGTRRNRRPRAAAQGGFNGHAHR